MLALYLMLNIFSITSLGSELAALDIVRQTLVFDAWFSLATYSMEVSYGDAATVDKSF